MRTLAVLLTVMVSLTIQPAFANTSRMHSADRAFPGDILMTVKSYSGSVDIKRTGETECQLSFELTCFFDLSGRMRPTAWNVSSPSLKGSYAELDGKPVGIESRAGSFNLDLKQDIGVGAHRLKLKYSGSMSVFSPERSKLAIYAGPSHFHLMSNWFPTCPAGMAFADLVKMEIELSLPKEWIVLGLNDPKLKGKPGPDGKHKLVRECTDPMKSEIAGGKYSQARQALGGGTVSVYTLHLSKADPAPVLSRAAEIVGFLENYFDRKATGEFFIAETTGLKGCKTGIAGGLLLDTAEFGASFDEAMLASELSRMCWLGGNGIAGCTKKPDCKFYEESLPSFFGLLYCMDKNPPDMKCNEYEKRVQEYHRNRSQNECAITDPLSVRDRNVSAQRAPLAINALCAYAGSDKFQNAMRSLLSRHSYTADKKTRLKADLQDFRRAVEEAVDHPIDDFWNFFFKSNNIFEVEFGIRRDRVEDAVVDRVSISGNTAPPFPLGFRLYYADGQSEDLLLVGASLEKILDRPGGGIDFIDRQMIIPCPTQQSNTMGASTIQAACAWRKPIVYCLKDDSPECFGRASELSRRFGSEVRDSIPDTLPQRPIIVTGKTAQLKLASAALKDFPIKWSEDGLVWGGKRFDGSFEMFALVTNISNADTPIIVDTGMSEIPDKCDKAAFFEKSDGTLRFSVDFADPSTASFPEPDLLDLPWTQKTVDVSSSILELPRISHNGCIMTYSGFDLETFDFRELSIALRQDAIDSILLGFQDGKAEIRIDCNTRFLSQSYSHELRLARQSRISEAGIGFKSPAVVSGNAIDVSWNKPLRFLFRLDGALGSKGWHSDSALRIGPLLPGKHRIQIVFLDEDGILSPVIEKEFITGAKPPTLKISTVPAVFKNGAVKVSGMTDPGCAIDPPCHVKQDGSFTLIVNLAKMQPFLTIKATDRNGLATETTVPLVRFRRIAMTLGQAEAIDEAGQASQMPVPPQSIKGITYVPMRFVGESLGAQVSWIEEEKKVVYTLDRTAVEIQIGKNEAMINGAIVPMPSPALVVSGRTLVPARFVGEALGAGVTWLPETKQIIIEYPPEKTE